MKLARRRLDVELVRRGLVASREQARHAVAAGEVTVNGAVAQKAARLVRPGDALELAGPPPRYVSRGGEKLQGALAAFGLDVAGMRCCDVGASTGGFTDCLLQHGATEVVAVDVGRAQMHERLARDPRVRVHERTDIRAINTAGGVAGIGGPFELVTADLSFISLTSVMDCLARLVAPGAALGGAEPGAAALGGAEPGAAALGGAAVVLVKPQFEAGRAEASRGRGVIRDPQQWEAALCRVLDAAAASGLAPVAAVPSGLRGAKGNVEFFAHLRHSEAPLASDGPLAAGGSQAAQITEMASQAVAQVEPQIVAGGQ